jgi:uncharacterized protein (DUF1778 family)
MATKRPKISIYISDEQKDLLEVQAKKQKRSISNLVSVIVEEWLTQKAKE